MVIFCMLLYCCCKINLARFSFDNFVPDIQITGTDRRNFIQTLLLKLRYCHGKDE